MKKFAMMIAALSLCACTFTACGDDDKDDNKNSGKAAIGADCNANDDCDSGFCSDAKKCAEKSVADDKKADGEACAKDDDCKSGNCDNKVCAAKSAEDGGKKADGEACESNDDCNSGNCDNKVCAAKSGGDDKKADGEACDKDDDCNSGSCGEDKKCAAKSEEKSCDADKDCEGSKNGKFACDVENHKCVECLSKDIVDAACDNSKPGPVCISNVCSKCTDDKQCGDGKVCNKDSGNCVIPDGTCWDDKDCTDKSKPVCSADHVCVASTAECGVNTACADKSKVCVASKCLDKAAKDDSCDDSFVARCSDDMRTLISCKDKKVIETTCKDYATPSSTEQYYCMYNPNGKADCVLECASKDANLKEGDIEFPNCTEDNKEAWNYTCLKDFYDSALFSFAVIEACENNKKCDDSGDKAVCK